MDNKPPVTYTISRRNGEYHVRFRENGVRRPEWDYFTDNREDAYCTAHATVLNYGLADRLAAWKARNPTS